MVRENTFFNDYKVLEIKRNGVYEYYLEKIGYGDLYFMYGTEEVCFPTPVVVLRYIKQANELNFWRD